ncbi:MAG: hypothetical protein L6R39_000254 [Caloplaca ligustica]|nr:MAG: hypothetical protein L6R39_000254 [Caloplaca ligustica]
MVALNGEGIIGSQEPHILIIGAGITGLVLAQALKRHGVAFTVFERDADVSGRGRGWGLTIHWSLDTFISLLPPNIVDRLPETYVDPEASKRGENGNFIFFDVRSGEPRWKVPPSKRIRVSRERLRALLLEGLDVQVNKNRGIEFWTLFCTYISCCATQWSRTLDSISTPTPHTVTALFTDSTSATGTLLIGADGSRSRVRSFLLSHNPPLAINNPLPVRLLGVSVIYPRALALNMRALDPFFFQGGDPDTDTFMYFSFLDTPANNTRDDADTYECQILLSWPWRSGFRGRDSPLDIPLANEDRVSLMKELVEGWADPFRECVVNIPADADVKAIALEDFIPRPGLWDNRDGRVTLMGDAAHAMTMCIYGPSVDCIGLLANPSSQVRGEAYNHGVADIDVLLSNILSTVYPSKTSSPTLKQAIDAYEAEMIQRTAPAVLTSRRACLDAHQYDRIDDQSPLVSKRVMITKE